MSIEALKEQARRHEQKEQWQKALDLYMQAVERMSVEQPDISLYNRAGDLNTRLGNILQAIECYERAVDLYLEAELPNNAIAVCKKTIRNVPTHAKTHLRMGRIRAKQGFVTDARASFVTYAEAVQAQGDNDEALTALIEFTEHAPDDYEMQQLVAAQLEALERNQEAAQHLVAAHAAMTSQGLSDEAGALEAKISELDSSAVLGAAAPTAGDEDDLGGFADFGAVDLDDSGEAETEAEEEPAAVPAEASDDSMGFGDVDLGFGDEEDDSPLPMMSFDDEDESVATAPEEAAEEAAEEAEEEEADLVPALGGEDEDEEDEDIDLPTFDFDSEDEAEEAEEEEAEELPLIGFGDDEEAEEEEAEVLEDALEDQAFESALDVVEEVGEEADAEEHEADDEAGELHIPLADVAEEVEEEAEEAASTPPPAAETGGSSGDDYVDLGSMILDTGEEKSTRFVVEYEEPSGDEQADFAKMLSQFKEKVAENLSADDVTAHYDLGTAYKEMGLIDEAISEYQAALRASANHLPTYEMLGQTFMEKGEHDAAVRSLSRALEIPTEIEDEFLGIYYYLGKAHEALGNTDEALEFYDRVFTLDINFADVTERLRALRP